MRRDLNDIKALFDDFMVNLHFIMRITCIHQDSTGQNGACEEGTYVTILSPYIQVTQIPDRVG